MIVPKSKLVNQWTFNGVTNRNVASHTDRWNLLGNPLWDNSASVPALSYIYLPRPQLGIGRLHMTGQHICH